MIYSKFPVQRTKSLREGTPRASGSFDTFSSDDTFSQWKHDQVKSEVSLSAHSDAQMDFEGILLCNRSLELHFSQFPADFGIESSFRMCKYEPSTLEEKRANGTIMKDELVALIHEIDSKAKVRKKPKQSDIIALFREQIDQEPRSVASKGPVYNALTLSQVRRIIDQLQKTNKLALSGEQLEHLETTFRDHVGLGTFNVSHFRVKAFLSAFPNRPKEAQCELDQGKMFEPRSKQEHLLTDLTLWMFMKQLCMPSHVFPTAVALKIKSVSDLVSHTKNVAKKDLAHICCHFCISQLQAQRLLSMCCDEQPDDRLCRDFCLLPRYFVYEEFIAFYRACEECAVPPDEVELAAYSFSIRVSDARGVSILSMFEVREVLQLHRTWPGAAIADISLRLSAAPPISISTRPLNLAKILVRVGLEMYAPILEEFDVQTMQHLQALNIDELTQRFPELGLDWEACARLQKLKAVDKDFILNNFASLDFETCKQSLQLHYSLPTTHFTSKFFGTTNAVTSFALFLCQGNFSQFQLAAFLSMHPGREAWVAKSSAGAAARFEFAEEQAASPNKVKLPNFFSPAPVLERIEFSFQDVAKRLALTSENFSESSNPQPEYSSIYSSIIDMFEKESLKLKSSTLGPQKKSSLPAVPQVKHQQPPAQAAGGGGGGGATESSDNAVSDLVKKRFALLPRCHLYDHVMKVRELVVEVFEMILLTLNFTLPLQMFSEPSDAADNFAYSLAVMLSDCDTSYTPSQSSHSIPFGRGLSRVSLYEVMAFFKRPQLEGYLENPRVDDQLRQLVKSHLLT